MVKWNIFGKTKSEKIEPQTNPESSQIESNNYSSTETDENLSFEKETTDQNIADYHETLQTRDTSGQGYTSYPSDQRYWRDVRAIEKKIDTLHLNKSDKPTSELEKKVDRIIKKKEKK